MASETLHTVLGPPIEDPDEETFLLFSQELPSNSLGFVDSHVDTLQYEIAGRTYVVRQSPGLLTSTRSRGTTGAVLWKITPLLASWLASLPPLLTSIHALHPDATIVELGCGLTGLIGLVLSRMVKCYILTDQEYVMKRLKDNISAHPVSSPKPGPKQMKKGDSTKPGQEQVLKTVPLDWETDDAENLKCVISPEASIDLLLLCDCVYNDFLIPPLVQTCVDICRLGSSQTKPTVVLIAQQLRSDSIFELFLDRMMKHFNVWRVPDEKISVELRCGSGYVVHMATLQD
ncbi:uncharacterized protein Z518_06411 [Rhinocladiella mackenziei CBS 650.93]|uniref:Diaminohydroxyphosphoribosylamino-pyrimidine deaminase n=1 Tax=Rhinocladiella mackenziei CBS 650.93 TaxID=1442369 RepID=A0A0D2III4_9EURO|nr:uncharacterized protein Z518_06411 [Rhinocladiella mackenziei CBS 650.93]KIX05539.1 hypothetical protein Z518_06411 [Rhinocladiella mackenziei CBS 650.93]